MDKVCDHTSVGILVWQKDTLLVIKRAKFPKTFSIPAGHVDQHRSFEDAAHAELKEEVGLSAATLIFIGSGRKENACRRTGGSWHEWKLYRAEGISGEVKGNLVETQSVGWYTKEEIRALIERTRAYQSGKIPEEEWEEHPGFEPVMSEWFEELNIV